jgi:hypothetical protein
MNSPQSRYQFTIDDSINGLVITYQRPRSWQLPIYSFIVSAVLFLFLTWAIAQMMTFFSSGAEPSTWIIMLIVVPVFLFTMLRTISTGLDSLLTTEKIQIDDQRVQVDKSGFQAMERNQTFTTNGKASFFLGRGIAKSLAVTGSKFLAQMYSIGMIHSSLNDPMHCFLRGISQQDAIEVLEKIKVKFPHYDIQYQNTANLLGGIGQS